MTKDTDTKSTEEKLSHVEHVKIASRGLRGDIAKTIADDSIVKFHEDDEQLTKFHGFYQGYDRDTATARKKQGLDKEWEMMLRAKLPGGRITAKQYLALDVLADKFSNGTLRVTSRQGIQFHSVQKGDIHGLINEINEAMLTTLGGCGDVVRNVMAVPSPLRIPAYKEIEETANLISDETLPTTTGYTEIFVDGKKHKPVTDETKDTVDPLYGTQWMPRKFKIAITGAEDDSPSMTTQASKDITSISAAALA